LGADDDVLFLLGEIYRCCELPHACFDRTRRALASFAFPRFDRDFDHRLPEIVDPIFVCFSALSSEQVVIG
jgi:hypothetical protein